MWTTPLSWKPDPVSQTDELPGVWCTVIAGEPDKGAGRMVDTTPETRGRPPELKSINPQTTNTTRTGRGCRPSDQDSDTTNRQAVVLLKFAAGPTAARNRVEIGMPNDCTETFTHFDHVTIEFASPSASPHRQ